MNEIKLTEEMEGLLVEFDEHGFAPTITMPNAEEYAKAWKNSLVDLFKRLLLREYDLKQCIKKLEMQNAFECGCVAEQQEEVERLKFALKNEENLCKIQTKKAVKDTAKEIYDEIGDSDILVVETQEYGEIEVVPIERLKEIVKSKGVEVE